MAKKKKTVGEYKEEYFPYIVEIYFDNSLIYFAKYKEKEPFIKGFKYTEFFENKNYPCKIQIEDEKIENEFTTELVKRIIEEQS